MIPLATAAMSMTMLLFADGYVIQFADWEVKSYEQCKKEIPLQLKRLRAADRVHPLTGAKRELIHVDIRCTQIDYTDVMKLVNSYSKVSGDDGSKSDVRY